jgi:hypothetical protein
MSNTAPTITNRTIEALEKALATQKPTTNHLPVEGDLWENGYCHDCETHTMVFSYPTPHGQERYICTSCKNISQDRKGAWWRKVEDLPKGILDQSCYLVIMPYYYGKGKTIAEAAKNCLGETKSKNVLVYHFLSSCPLASGDINVDSMGSTSWHNDTKMVRIIEGGISLASLRKEGILAKNKRSTLED